MERARTEWLRALGIRSRSSLTASTAWCSRSSRRTSNYRKPARLDDELP